MRDGHGKREMGDEAEESAQTADGETSRNQTAKRAALILVSRDSGFIIPTAKQKRTLLVAFARRNLVIYGKAFDVLRTPVPMDLGHEADVEKHWDSIIFHEIKSTSKPLPPDFTGYFFAPTTAELLVARSLKQRYKFAFVNTGTQSHLDLAFPQVLAKAKGVHPTWSISF